MTVSSITPSIVSMASGLATVPGNPSLFSQRTDMEDPKEVSTQSTQVGQMPSSSAFDKPRLRILAFCKFETEQQAQPNRWGKPEAREKWLTDICKSWVGVLLKSSPAKSKEDYWQSLKQTYDVQIAKIERWLHDNHVLQAVKEEVRQKLLGITQDSILEGFVKSFAEKDFSFPLILSAFQKQWGYSLKEIEDQFNKAKAECRVSIEGFKQLMSSPNTSQDGIARSLQAKNQEIDAYERCLRYIDVDRGVIKKLRELELNAQSPEYLKKVQSFLLKEAEKAIDDAVRTNAYYEKLPSCYEARKMKLDFLLSQAFNGNQEKVNGYKEEFKKAFCEAVTAKFGAQPREYLTFEDFQRELNNLCKGWDQEIRALFITKLRTHLVYWKDQSQREVNEYAARKQEASASPLHIDRETNGFYEGLERGKNEDLQAYKKCIGFVDKYELLSEPTRYFQQEITPYPIRLNIIVALWRDTYRSMDPTLASWSDEQIRNHIIQTPKSPEMIAFAKAWTRAHPKAATINRGSKVEPSSAKTAISAVSSNQEISFKKEAFYKKAMIISAVFSTLFWIFTGVPAIAGIALSSLVLLPIIGWACLALSVAIFLYTTTIFLRANSDRVEVLDTWGHTAMYILAGILFPPALPFGIGISKDEDAQERRRRALQVMLERHDTALDPSLL